MVSSAVNCSSVTDSARSLTSAPGLQFPLQSRCPWASQTRTPLCSGGKAARRGQGSAWERGTSAVRRVYYWHRSGLVIDILPAPLPGRFKN